MEKQIRDAMNDSIILEASKRYNVDHNSINRVGGFENFIYEYKQHDEEVILRFVHSTHRTFEQVLAEIEFIDYLSDNGANVSTIIKDKDNQIASLIECGNNDYFTVSAFTKAPGSFIREQRNDPQFNYLFGQAVGKLHKLTKTFTPKHKRYQWYEEDYIEMGKRNLPEDLQYLVKIAEEHQELIKSYAMSVDDYGLIHTDLHFGNMFYDNETLTFFDFDDASYKHFISDIAIIIYYQFGLSPLSDTEIEDKTIAFLKPFLKGYETENKLDKKWFYKLNEFLRLRSIILIMVVYSAGEEVINGPFGQMLFNKFLPRIKNNTPFFDVERVINGIY